MFISDFLVLFSAWLWWDYQSAIYNSGPGLFKMCMLYWCMCSIVHCNHWDNIAMSLLTIATNGLCSVVTYTSLAKQQWWNFSSSCNMQSVFCSMLLHCHFVLDKLLQVNAVGFRVALSGTLSCPQFIPSLTWNKPAPRTMLDASISRYRGLTHYKISCMHLS